MKTIDRMLYKAKKSNSINSHSVCHCDMCGYDPSLNKYWVGYQTADGEHHQLYYDSIDALDSALKGIENDLQASWGESILILNKPVLKGNKLVLQSKMDEYTPSFFDDIERWFTT